jgi:hypothetical protein
METLRSFLTISLALTAGYFIIYYLKTTQNVDVVKSPEMLHAQNQDDHREYFIRTQGEHLKRTQGEHLKRTQGEHLKRTQGEHLKRTQGEHRQRAQGDIQHHLQKTMDSSDKISQAVSDEIKIKVKSTPHNPDDGLFGVMNKALSSVSAWVGSAKAPELENFDDYAPVIPESCTSAQNIIKYTGDQHRQKHKEPNPIEKTNRPEHSVSAFNSELSVPFNEFHPTDAIETQFTPPSNTLNWTASPPPPPPPSNGLLKATSSENCMPFGSDDMKYSTL